MPGRIHEVSLSCEGSFKFAIRLDSIRSPGFSPIIIVRHGERRGARLETATSGSSGRGESSVITACGAPATPVKYMPAQSVRLASVMATHAGPACTSSGHPMMSPGRIWLSVILLNSRFLVAEEAAVVRGPNRFVGGEVEFAALGGELEGAHARLLRQRVAERRAVIRRAHDELQFPFRRAGLLERQRQFVGAIPDLLARAPDRRPGLIDGAPLLSRQRRGRGRSTACP